MATSGTVAETQIPLIDLVEASLGRANPSTTPNQLTAADLRAAKRHLYLILTSMTGTSNQLWTQERRLIGLVPGRSSLPMPTGTVDVISAQYRRIVRLDTFTVTTTAGNTGTLGSLSDGDTDTRHTASSTGGEVRWDFSADTPRTVRIVGLLAGDTASHTYSFETSDDGIAWEINLTASVNSAVREWDWFEINFSRRRRYFRVRETYAGSTLSFYEVVLAEEWNSRPMRRMNRDQFHELNNARVNSDYPSQFWFDRQIDPVMHVWSEPQNDLHCIHVLRQRLPDDLGLLTNTLDAPVRWHRALINRLARAVHPELPGADPNRLQLLVAEDEATWAEATREERDRSPVKIVPNFRSRR